MESGTSLELQSEPGGIAWAYWSFSGLPRVVSRLEFNMNFSPGGEYYVAVADYRQSRWQFLGPFTGTAVFRADSLDFFSPDGNFYALALTADGSAASVARLEVTFGDNWQYIDLLPSAPIPWIVIDDGLPIVLYLEGGDFRLLRSSTQYGDSPDDWTQSLLGPYTDSITDVSLALVNGEVAVTWKERPSCSVNYLRAGMDSHITIDTDLTNGGGFSSLLEVQGHAAIAYRDGDGGPAGMGELLYVRSSTPNGEQSTDWDNKLTVYDAGSGGDEMVMGIVDGRPAIASNGYAQGNVFYHWSDDPTGEDPQGWHSRVIANISGRMEFINLDVAAGVPVVSYTDFGFNGTGLWYLHANVPAPKDEPGDWSAAFQVDSETYSGFFGSMSLTHGRPWITHFRELGTDYEMRYAIPSTLNGTEGSWHWAEFLDGERGPDSYFCDSLAIGGRLVVCYGDRGGAGGDSLRWCWREEGRFEQVVWP